MLDLDLDFPTRPYSPPTIAIVREVQPTDMVLLSTERREPTNSGLKKLRERHHSLARLLAAGLTDGQCSIVTGYAPTTVSILKADPTFKELLLFYREQVNVEFADTMSMFAGMTKDALLEIRDRLEEAPEKISMSQLIELTKLGADRTGFGPSSQQTNVNVNVDMADRMERARQRRIATRKVLEDDSS